MTVKVTRRDFLNGVAVGASAALLAPSEVLGQIAPGLSVPSTAPASYPPTLTGLRGSHVGSFETAHALAWDGEKPAHYQALDEHYDLVVVGAGISGLATAWFYQKRWDLGHAFSFWIIMTISAGMQNATSFTTRAECCWDWAVPKTLNHLAVME